MCSCILSEQQECYFNILVLLRETLLCFGSLQHQLFGILASFLTLPQYTFQRRHTSQHLEASYKVLCPSLPLFPGNFTFFISCSSSSGRMHKLPREFPLATVHLQLILETAREEHLNQTVSATNLVERRECINPYIKANRERNSCFMGTLEP